MKYVALLRGINVGNSKRIEMKKLKEIFEKIGYKNVATYINSGNVIFESENKYDEIKEVVERELFIECSTIIPVLIKTIEEIKSVVEVIPKEWVNNETQKTDVAYLFPEIDFEEILNELPIKREYINLKYTKGAIIWNVERYNYNKSQLNKLIGHKSYQYMTVRNINTSRYLSTL